MRASAAREAAGVLLQSQRARCSYRGDSSAGLDILTAESIERGDHTGYRGEDRPRCGRRAVGRLSTLVGRYSGIILRACHQTLLIKRFHTLKFGPGGIQLDAGGTVGIAAGDS